MGQIRSHFRVKKIRCQLADIRSGLEYFHGTSDQFPLGWALVPLRRAGIDGDDNRIDLQGKGRRVLTRGVTVLEPYCAVAYFLDDAEALENCTPATRWLQWADDRYLLKIPKDELRCMSEIAYWACLEEIERNPVLLLPKVIDNLERYAELGG